VLSILFTARALDEDHMALRVRAMRDGEECERLILLKPHEQEIVRTRISHIAKPKEIVLCEFSLEEMPERLNVKDAEEIFRNQYWIEDEITVKSLAQNLHMVMLFTERDCLAATGEEKGPAGEWMTFRILWDYGLFKGYQVKVEGTEGNIFADFKARGEHLVEVKNIDPRWVSDEDWLSKLKGQLVKYEGIVRAKNAEDVLLFFCNPLGQEELASLNDKLSKWFDDLSWLKVCNGKEEFIRNLIGS